MLHVSLLKEISPIYLLFFKRMFWFMPNAQCESRVGTKSMNQDMWVITVVSRVSCNGFFCTTLIICEVCVGFHASQCQSKMIMESVG